MIGTTLYIITTQNGHQFIIQLFHIREKFSYLAVQIFEVTQQIKLNLLFLYIHGTTTL